MALREEKHRLDEILKRGLSGLAGGTGGLSLMLTEN